jgi:hypothetical protein
MQDHAHRYPVTIIVVFCDERASGGGRIWDLSAAGARIEEVNYLPRIETRLSLVFAPLNRNVAIEISAQVVRWTETGGFAVRFCAMDDQAEALLLATLNEAALLAKSELKDTAGENGVSTEARP